MRRVATLVARGVPPEELFAAVVEEIGRLFSVAYVAMGRYEPDGALTIVAGSSLAGAIPVGSRWALGGTTSPRSFSRPAVRPGSTTRRCLRTDRCRRPRGGVGSGVGSTGHRRGPPLGCDNRASTPEQPLPADTEARLANFTELVATAIANAESRAELMASRARIVAAADETRRRIERDLHDGIQQRLVSLGLEVRAAQATVPRCSSASSRARWRG